LEANAVWQYANSDGVGEKFVRPVKKVPVKNSTGKLIRMQVRLANGAGEAGSLTLRDVGVMTM
jgi:hypothetical protein